MKNIDGYRQNVCEKQKTEPADTVAGEAFAQGRIGTFC